jgi:hypothetical protein
MNRWCAAGKERAARVPILSIQKKVSARTIGRIEKISAIGKSCRRVKSAATR